MIRNAGSLLEKKVAQGWLLERKWGPHSYNWKQPDSANSWANMCVDYHCLHLQHTCSCGISTEPQYILPRFCLPQSCHSITHHLHFHLPGFPRTRTPEGLDLTFATNYIGPFLLTNLLQGKEGWVLTFCAAHASPFPRCFRGLLSHLFSLGTWTLAEWWPQMLFLDTTGNPPGTSQD